MRNEPITMNEFANSVREDLQDRLALRRNPQSRMKKKQPARSRIRNRRQRPWMR